MTDLARNIKTENLPIEFKATFSRMVSKAEIKDLKNYTLIGITQAYAITGFKSNLTQEQYKKELSFLVESVCELIIKKVPRLRIEEIPFAFKNGALSEYGPFQGLSVATFIFFAKSYYDSENRSRMILANRIEDKKPKPTKEEELAAVKDTIIKAYQSFIEKGSYEDYGNFVYDKMDKFGLIALSPFKKDEIYNQAKQSIEAKKNPQNAGNRQEFKSLSKALELINNPDSISGRNMIKNVAKKIALQVVFQDLLKVKIDIEQLINQEINF